MYFEELQKGAVFTTPSLVVSAEDIREFAMRFDPQPMHLDSDAAVRSAFDDVIASGFHTVAVAWSLWVRHGMHTHGRGGISLTDVRWHRPVYAGTELHCVVRVSEARLTSRGKGLATLHFEVYAEADLLVLEFETTGLFALRSDTSV